MRGNQITSFNVSYVSRDPHVAQQVTGELTNLFISENLEVRQTAVRRHHQVSRDPVGNCAPEPLRAGRKVRQFKAQHVGEMPAQLTSNLQILGGLQSQLQSEEDALNTARQQAFTCRRWPISPHPAGIDQGPGTLPRWDYRLSTQELDRLKAQLADLSSHYTDRHPDVRKVKDQIAKTEKMRDQLMAAAKEHGQTTPQTANPPVADPAQSDGVGVRFRASCAPIRLEIANREHSIAALKAKIDEYQGRLNQEPIREQQLADLTRGYEQSKANYDDLLKKKNESAMATSMELLQQGERFTMMDPPSLPAKPEFPNRLKFCGIGLGHWNGVWVSRRRSIRDDGRSSLRRKGTQEAAAGAVISRRSRRS